MIFLEGFLHARVYYITHMQYYLKTRLLSTWQITVVLSLTVKNKSQAKEKVINTSARSSGCSSYGM